MGPALVGDRKRQAPTFPHSQLWDDSKELAQTPRELTISYMKATQSS